MSNQKQMTNDVPAAVPKHILDGLREMSGTTAVKGGLLNDILDRLLYLEGVVEKLTGAREALMAAGVFVAMNGKVVAGSQLSERAFRREVAAKLIDLDASIRETT